jgi:3-hydroxyacyl-CoA dehydrogenase
MQEIRKVAVIGAGVMGAAIAAHVANAGVPVVLLDIVPKDATDRSIVAKTAIEKLLKTDPAPFMRKANARLVTPGNIEDDIALLADADLIVEAIIERLDLKQALYDKIEAVRKDGSIVSSNTSTIPLAKLVEGRPERFVQDFLITHFFNPPRYMRLLEIVTGPGTSAAALETVEQFADVKLGKSVVRCMDRPGFIANRLGVYWLQSAVVKAIELNLTVEEADAIIGKPMGIPKTGVFALLDMVGIDLMPHVNASMAASLPKDDPFHAMNRPLPLVERMIAEGLTGRKGKGGFYRINREQGKRKEAIDLRTGVYRPSDKPEIAALASGGKNLKRLLSDASAHGRYALEVMGATLSYAAQLVGDAADSIDKIDEAMRLGYNWKSGPFELMDQLGPDWVIAAFEKLGLPIANILRFAAGRTFYRVEGGVRQALSLDGTYHDLKRPAGVVMLADIKLAAKPIIKNGSAALWDVGDGVACFEFTSKMNSIDSETFTLLAKALPIVGERFKALVLYNEGTNFSAGANLGYALFAINLAGWGQVDEMVSGGQRLMKAMRYAPFPVIGAPSGLALGGGCEFLLHCDAVQAHAETYMGLVEVGVGLIPGWGGCKEMLARWSAPGRLPNGPMPAVAKAFEIISTATVSKSAAEAQELGYLRETDGITMNRYRLLADAKRKALAIAETYVPPSPPAYVLPGPSGKVALRMAVDSFHKLGKATDYDVVVSGALATVLTGDGTDVTETLTEDDVLRLERENFAKLVRQRGTADRIAHMLETGKPLRN